MSELTELTAGGGGSLDPGEGVALPGRMPGDGTKAAAVVAYWCREVAAGREPAIKAAARAAGCSPPAAKEALRRAGLLASKDIAGAAADRVAADIAKGKRRAVQPMAVQVAADVLAGAVAAGVPVREAAAGLVLVAVVEGQRSQIQTASEAAADLLAQVREIARPSVQPGGFTEIDPGRTAQGVALLDKLAGTIERLHAMQRDAFGIDRAGRPSAIDTADTLATLAQAARAAAIAGRTNELTRPAAAE